MRIQKILSQRGVASRRKAEELISAGRVTCNGQVCTLGESADPETDTILIDGRPLPAMPENVYLMLHKPAGYVTTLSDEQGRPDAASLVAGCGQRVYPVGRLDMDSEGLLLFTNDGEFANRLMHPKHLVDKTYLVAVEGYSPEGYTLLGQSFVLEGYRIAQPQVSLVSRKGGTARLLVTIHEGRNRQVRKMCGRAGMQVTRLIRIKEGPLELGDLPQGQWRYLTKEEIDTL